MEFVDEQEKLLEPLKYYKTEVAKNFLDKLTDNFENLLRKSGIDIEANKKSVSDYNEISKVKVKNEKKLKWAERFYILFFYSTLFLLPSYLLSFDSFQLFAILLQICMPVHNSN